MSGLIRTVRRNGRIAADKGGFGGYGRVGNALQAILTASRTIPLVIWAINYDPIALG